MVGWSVGQSEIKANSASVAVEVEVEVEVEAELGKNLQLADVCLTMVDIQINGVIRNFIPHVNSFLVSVDPTLLIS